MNDKLFDKCLLTPEEQDSLRDKWWHSSPQKYDGLTNSTAQEQLTKAIPIIKADERKRIAEEIKNMPLPDPHHRRVRAFCKEEVFVDYPKTVREVQQELHKAILDKLKGAK